MGNIILLTSGVSSPVKQGVIMPAKVDVVFTNDVSEPA